MNMTSRAPVFTQQSGQSLCSGPAVNCHWRAGGFVPQSSTQAGKAS